MRLGWIGPGIVIAGAAIAGVAIWYWKSVQPIAGDEIDKVPCGGGTTMIARAEVGGDRSFVELRGAGDQIVWQALVPHYAGRFGRTAIACGDTTATVRIERSGRAEVFGMLLQNGEKVGGFRLATEHEPITTEPTGPITLTDHVRSYEFVGGAGWHEVIAVDLATGKALWKVDLGAEPVRDATVEASRLHVRQGNRDRFWDAPTGRDETVTQPSN
jgi:hypothetical protein